MHFKAGVLVSCSTKCIEYLVCAGHWLAFEDCKDQSEMVPGMPFHDAHTRYRKGAVCRAGSSVPTVWRGREGLMEGPWDGCRVTGG